MLVVQFDDHKTPPALEAQSSDDSYAPQPHQLVRDTSLQVLVLAHLEVLAPICILRH